MTVWIGGVVTLKNRARAILPAALWHSLSAVKQYFARRRAVGRLYADYFAPNISALRPLVMASRETSDFTYDLTPQNLRYLAELVACATARPAAEIAAYIDEAINDTKLNAAAARGVLGKPPYRRSPFGRRLGWYAIARAIKPKVIVETGVSRGHGAIMLCAALLRNGAEGSPGRYFGTDKDLEAGRLLTGSYATVGTILYGDSLQSLAALDETIDLFINDSDHSADYEAREYRAIAGKLSGTGFILADNAHVTDRLALFSRETGRQFLYFQESPENHWYPGGGIGISFPPRPAL